MQLVEGSAASAPGPARDSSDHIPKTQLCLKGFTQAVRVGIYVYIVLACFIYMCLHI